MTLALAALVAGCSETPGPAELDDAAEPRLAAPPLQVIADGTYAYHDAQAGNVVYAPGVALNAASQVAVAPCSNDGGGVYFNNRPIPTPTGDFPRRNGTLRVTFDWTDADYPQPTLVAGYRAPGMSAVADSPRIARGETVDIRIEPSDASAGKWALYACLNPSTEGTAGDAGWQPGPFLWKFTVHAEFQGDPELVVPDEPRDGPRTSDG